MKRFRAKVGEATRTRAAANGYHMFRGGYLAALSDIDLTGLKPNTPQTRSRCADAALRRWVQSGTVAPVEDTHANDRYEQPVQETHRTPTGDTGLAAILTRFQQLWDEGVWDDARLTAAVMHLDLAAEADVAQVLALRASLAEAWALLTAAQYVITDDELRGRIETWLADAGRTDRTGSDSAELGDDLSSGEDRSDVR